MKKKILFVCKHNIFRSIIAEELFRKYNKNKNYTSDSAGLIPYKKKDLKNNIGYSTEKEITKNLGLKMPFKSKAMSSELLSKTDLLIITANDVPKEIFKNEKAYNKKVIKWELEDVHDYHKNKKEIAEKTIKDLDKKIKNLVKSLK